MEIFLIFYIYFDFMTQVALQYHTGWKSGDESSKYFDEIPNTMLSSEDYYHIVRGINDGVKCVKRCSKTPKCRALNVIKKSNGVFNCKFFAFSNGVQQYKTGTTLFVHQEGQCLGYCEELSYLKLCQKCKCVSLCSPYLPHYCDCTHVQGNPIENCDTPYRVSGGYPLAGQYEVFLDNNNMVIPVFCQSHLKNPKGDLWMTILRRLNIDNNKKSLFDELKRNGAASYVSGFGVPYLVNYFMGYDKISRYTSTKQNVRLSIILLSQEKVPYYIEYDNFQLKHHADNERYETSYSRMRNHHCLQNFLTDENIQLDCAQAEIFGNRVKDKIQLGMDTTQEYVAVTYLLRSIENDIPEADNLIEQTGFIRNLYLEGSLCINFEFKVSLYTTATILSIIKVEGNAQAHTRFQFRSNDKISYIFKSAPTRSDWFTKKLDYKLNTFNELHYFISKKTEDIWLLKVFLNGKYCFSHETRYNMDLKPARYDIISPKSAVILKNLYINGKLIINQGLK